ncbi:MAG: DUF2269 family protein [Myxococcales bacterium]|nr:DUF2269 family protein [Myxococcales bacterium]
MNVYSSVVFLHIASASVLIGSSLSSQFVRDALRRARTVREVAGWLDFERRSTRANPIAAMTLLATGLYLGSAGWWTSGWFVVSVVLFVFSAAWAVRVVVTELGLIGRAAAEASDGPVPAALDELRWSERLDLAADALLGADAAALFLMVTKPGPAGAIGVAALGLGAAFAARLVRRRTRATASGAMTSSDA